MIQSELLLHNSWQPFFFTSSTFNHTTPYHDDKVLDFCEFSRSISSSEAESSSSVLSSNCYFPTMIPDEFSDLENFVNNVQTWSPMEGLETAISSEVTDDINEWINGNDKEGNSSSYNEWSPCLSVDSSQISSTKVDEQMALIHLLKAYGEAMGNGEDKLAEVITRSIKEKSSPVGNTVQRVAYNLFQSREDQSEYIRQESSKNFLPALKVLCQSIPISRFAHFTATSAILESMPDDASTIHVVDFHIGEGLQWPLLIEALSAKQRRTQVQITSVKQEDCSYWTFEDTKKRLLSHARQYGVKLRMDEKSLEDILQEMQGPQGTEWMVFNCMVGLPHMAGRQTRTSAAEFLKVAKELSKNRKGIVVVGDGEATGESSSKACSSYSLYFDHLLRHYHALFESLEKNFPVYLVEARTAMENLFLSPLMCPKAWFEEWKEMMETGHDVLAELEMEGLKQSRESLGVAKQLVSEGEKSYRVEIETRSEHVMVLQWNDTPLVRVSTWK